MSADIWSTAREGMLLDPTIANLNTGSFGPLSRRVFDAVTALRHRLAEEPMDFLVRRVPPLLWRARQSLATFLACEPQQLVFTANVTASINLVAASLHLAAGGEILLTDHEYGAMHWCWERAARRLGLTLRTFALPTASERPSDIVEAAVRAMTPATRLFFFSHVLSPTGLVLPARELCVEARRRGILTVIDGAHAPVFVPLRLADIPCDFYGGNCHKWMLAPTGSGFLYFGAGNEERLLPLQVSWGWHTSETCRGQALGLDEPDSFGSTPRIRRLEFEGTRDICPWLVVPEAIEFQAGLGMDAIRQRQRELVGHVRRCLGEKLALRLATPENPALSGPLTAVELPAGVNAETLRRSLWNARIEAPVIERPDRLLLRISTHFYNTVQEIDRLTDLLPGTLRENGASVSAHRV